MYTDISPEVNGIAIRTICQHPELDAPFGGLVFDVLADTTSVSRFHHMFINGQMLFWLIQTKTPRFQIINERLYFT